MIGLAGLISADIRQLLSASGKELIQQVGIDIVRGVVFDVLTGKNLRDSTEVLTRRRIAALNLATLHLFLKGSMDYKDFVNRLPYMATDMLLRRRLHKAERWFAQWVLGLTDKAVQNVIRDDPRFLEEYRDRYIQTCQEVLRQSETLYGTLTGELRLRSDLKAELDWVMMLYLLNTIGAQTLTIRGSEKSAYGKLFEKLILWS
jgi:hypothetical protein